MPSEPAEPAEPDVVPGEIPLRPVTVDTLLPGPAAGPEPEAPARDRRYLPALDGLRALAVGVVLAYHLGRLRGGFLGVDLFFVISGYLITSLLLAEVRSSGRVSLAEFWKRRFRRLLPALLVVLVAVVVAGNAWFPAWRRSGLRVDALAALGYVGNWRFILSKQSYFASGIGPSPLRHVWSLAIEEQFYVVWPLVVTAVVLAVSRRRLRAALGTVAAVGAVGSIAWMAVLGGGSKDPSRAYYGTDTRAFTILIGVLLAIALADAPGRYASRASRTNRLRVMSMLSVPALAGAAAFVVVADNQRHWMYRGGFVAFGLLAAALVAGCVADRGPLAAALAWRPLRWIGRVSYGIYLWSWPVQTFAQAHFRLHGWELDAWVGAVVVGAAALSARFVERPFRTGRLLAERPATVRRLAPAFGIAVTAVVVLAATAGATKEPDFLHVSDKAAAAVALRPAKLPPPSLTTSTAPATTVPPSTVPGATTVPPTTVPPTLGRPLRVMVTGDSVGWSLGWGLVSDGSVADAEIDDRGLIGCGVMPQADSRWITAASASPQPYYPDCAQQPQAEAIGLQGRPDAVVLSAGTWEVYDQEYLGKRWRVGTTAYENLLIELLQARIDRFRSVGAITVLPLVPCFGPETANLGNERTDVRRVDWMNAVLRRVARHNRADVITVDTSEVVCHGRTPLTNIPGVGDPRPDGVHYTVESARWLWNTWLTAKVTAAVLAHNARVAAAAAASTTTTVPPSSAPVAPVTTASPG